MQSYSSVGAPRDLNVLQCPLHLSVHPQLKCIVEPKISAVSTWARGSFRNLPGCLGSGGCFPTRSKPSGQQMMFTSCDIILKANII